MTLSAIGWFVVHSVWQCTLVAGVTAMILSLLPDRRATARYRIACASLATMAVLGIVTAVNGTEGVRSVMSGRVMYAVDDVIGLPALIAWGSVIVPVAAVLWMAGVALALINTGFAWRRVRRLRRLDLDDPGPAAQAVVADLRTQMSLRGDVDLRASAAATVPMVIGWQRPLVLLPAGTVNRLTAGQLRAVLAHELAHVRRSDYAVNLILIAAEILLFHHPAAIWVARRIRTEREYCCDDVAVSMAETSAYGRALAALEDTRAECRLVVAAASGTLLDRIQRIAGQPRPMMTPIRGALALIGAIIVGGALLAVTVTVPPSLPAGTKMRRPGPPPAGFMPPPGNLKQRQPR
jgi:bla regulator protein BlaR1